MASLAMLPDQSAGSKREGRDLPAVLVACPDARTPAYEAVAGLAAEGMLDRFVTGFYHREGPWAGLSSEATRRWLRRRSHPGIPADRVRSDWTYDLSLRLEGRLARNRSHSRHHLARARTERFDRLVAAQLRRHQPDVAFVFSDVASRVALPACRELGIGSILSMVHGDVREERQVLEREAERAPDFFPIYLTDGPIDREELDWLHERRLKDIELADLILVPSEHIAGWLMRHGTNAERVRVVPYAADTKRFLPDPEKRFDRDRCTFLFAGGITQRKGIKYLLEAWRQVRRPGWRLQLLGGMPADPAPLESYRDEFEWLGRVGHAEMAARMAAADVFVFPSLFEGSAVVTYEALACGLPSIVTAAAGAVVRDGIEGLIVPAGEIPLLAEAIEQLGVDPDRRAAMARAARARAEAFDWPRYHASLSEAVVSLSAARFREEKGWEQRRNGVRPLPARG